LNKGFTLVEVLIASFLMCIFAASFAFLLNAGIKQARTSKQLTGSVFVSKSMMEELRSKPFDSLFSYNNVTFDNGNGKITVAPAGNDLISVTVRHKIELNTLRSRY